MNAFLFFLILKSDFYYYFLTKLKIKNLNLKFHNNLS